MSGRRKDYSNQVFNYLTCLKFDKIVKNETFWICRCECGVIKSLRISQVQIGKPKSCGCKKNKLISESKKLKEGEASYNFLLRRYKNSAKERNIIWNLDNFEFKLLVNLNCYYCNKEPNQFSKTQNKTTGYYKYNGIDRLNSKEGYTHKNCVACCKTCNFAKNDLTIEEFKNWIELVYKRINLI